MGMYIHHWNFRNFSPCTCLKAPSANGSAPIRSWTEIFWSLQAQVANLKKKLYTFYSSSKNLWQEMFEVEFGIWKFEIGFWNRVCNFDFDFINLKFDLKNFKSEKFELEFEIWNCEIGFWNWVCKFDLEIINLKFVLKMLKSENFRIRFGAERKYFEAWFWNLKNEILNV